MSLFIGAFLCLAVVCALALIVTTQLNKRLSSRRTSLWKLEEHSDGRTLRVSVERPGDFPLLVGQVAFSDPDFEYQIEVARATARQRLVALNAGRRLPSG